MPSHFIPTADLVDIIGADVRSCDTQFHNFGGETDYCGEISTLTCFEDNGLVKATLHSPGDGKVLVVDGDASLHTALMGDLIAQAGVDNGWAGVVILGAIRDSAAISRMPFGVKALGTNPRKSAKNAVGEKNTTVSFGGVDFIPGHFLYADADGIVVTEHPVEEK